MRTRRDFLKVVAAAAGTSLLTRASAFGEKGTRKRLPVEKTMTTIYRSLNDSPGENLKKVLDLGGGIERIVGQDDVVLIKPNVQWWNQGAPNLAALSRFVEILFDRPGGFRGEVVLAENCHRGSSPIESRQSGWARQFERNADLDGIQTVGGLGERLKKQYGRRLTVYHWVNVSAGGRRVTGPKDGDGYVYCSGTDGVPLLSCDNGAAGPDRRSTIMTYPVFTTDQGTVVDFRNGIWEKGAYTGRPMKVVLFSALNHHSTYCGVTSSLKNYMGIVDLSGGPDPRNGGRLTGEYYNFHSFPFDKWAPGPKAGMLGTAIGTFIRTIRKADLHVTTAEWVGLASRVDLPASRTRAVLAGTDPVALDFHAAKYILYPNSGIFVHDPENERGPLYQYLAKAAECGAGILDETLVNVNSFDFAKRGWQTDGELAVVGEKFWGSDLRAIAKYLCLRLAY